MKERAAREKESGGQRLQIKEATASLIRREQNRVLRIWKRNKRSREQGRTGEGMGEGEEEQERAWWISVEQVGRQSRH